MMMMMILRDLQPFNLY